MAAISTLAVSGFYMIAQMVGAGSIVSLLIPQLNFETAIVLVGVLMLVYVVFGGMLATTWVQIIKAVLLMGATILLSIFVLAHYHFSMTELFAAAAGVKGTDQGRGAATSSRPRTSRSRACSTMASRARSA